MTGCSRALRWLTVFAVVATVHGWSSPWKSQVLTLRSSSSLPKNRFVGARSSTVGSLQVATTSTSATTAKTSPALSDQDQQLRKEGGLFAFKTKYGALNPFGIYYGLTSIFLGIVWYIALSGMQLVYWITRGRFDKQRKIPIFINQAWGIALLRLTRSLPEMENKHILEEFYKRKEPAMFVANHNSWMDIPFLGATVGWRNYKLVSKKELAKVPILGKAIRVGGHIMVDRVDRRSQVETLKKGINYLKNGVHLCTFPEGTRTRSGKLGAFKNGAFKMAHKVGAPVIPVSIVASGKVMPSHWMFPNRASYGVAKVVVHEPVESKDKTEDELAEAVRQAIISGLPEDQRPLE